MTDLRTAAQQALEVLEDWESPVALPAIVALRAALAEPRPIHECYGDCPTNPQTCPNPCNFEGRPRPVQEPVFEVGFGWLDDATKYPRGTKLYVAPPQRKPLSEEEIKRIDDSTHFHESPDWSLRFARAIERAHGITP